MVKLQWVQENENKGGDSFTCLHHPPTSTQHIGGRRCRQASNTSRMTTVGCICFAYAACGVDIRPNTVVTVKEDGVGIVNGDDIDGFETCVAEID